MISIIIFLLILNWFIIGGIIFDIAVRCPVYVPVKVVHMSLWETQLGSCKKMKGCVVTEKTLVCYKGDEKKHVQTNNQQIMQENERLRRH